MPLSIDQPSPFAPLKELDAFIADMDARLQTVPEQDRRQVLEAMWKARADREEHLRHRSLFAQPSAIQEGVEAARISGKKDALFQAAITGSVIAAALFTPVAWFFWKIAIFLAGMFLAGIIIPAVKGGGRRGIKTIFCFLFALGAVALAVAFRPPTQHKAPAWHWDIANPHSTWDAK
jgi:hypothetical protein